MDIKRPPEEDFDYCSDLTREPEWNPKMKRVTKLTAGPEGVGTRYEAEFPGDSMVVECVHFERPVAWSTIGVSRRLEVSFEGRVSSAENGAHLVMRMALQPRGLLRWVAPLIRRYMQAQLERNSPPLRWYWRGEAGEYGAPDDRAGVGSSAGVRVGVR